MKTYNQFIEEKGEAYKGLTNAQKRRRYDDYKENFEHAGSNHQGHEDEILSKVMPDAKKHDQKTAATVMTKNAIVEEAMSEIAACKCLLGPKDSTEKHCLPGTSGNLTKVPYKQVFGFTSELYTNPSGKKFNRKAIMFQPDLTRFRMEGVPGGEGAINFDGEWNTIVNIGSFQALYDMFAVHNMHIKIIPISNWTKTSGTITAFNFSPGDDLERTAITDEELKDRAWSDTYRGTRSAEVDAKILTAEAWEMRPCVMNRESGNYTGGKPQSSPLDFSSAQMMGFLNDQSGFSDATVNAFLDYSRIDGWGRPGFYVDSTEEEELDFEIEVTCDLYFTPKLNTYGNPTLNSGKDNRGPSKGKTLKKYNELAKQGKNKIKKASQTAERILDGIETVGEVGLTIASIL